MDFGYSQRTQDLQARVQRFMDEHVYPAEAAYWSEIEANSAAGKRWTPLETIEKLKPKARAQGLWNLFLPPSADGQHDTAGDYGIGLSMWVKTQELANGTFYYVGALTEKTFFFHQWVFFANWTLALGAVVFGLYLLVNRKGGGTPVAA